jgi:hypothetical protein
VTWPFGLPVLGLAARLNPLTVFAAAAFVLTLVNIACCAWLQRRWEVWIAGNARQLEARLAKTRSGRVMRRPVAWITRGSDGWFALAAVLVGAVIVVALARFTGGEPISKRRIRLASIGYSIFFAAVYSAIGFAVGDAIRAV